MDETEKALRYRNYAEELRIIAAEGATPAGRESLLLLAQEYDQLATSMESILRAKIATGQRPTRRP